MTSPLLSWRGTINDPCQHYWMKNPHCPSVAAQPGNWNSSLGLAIEESAFISFTVGGGQCVLQSVAEHTAKLTWCLFSVAINHLSNFKNKDHSFHKKKPTLSKLQQPPPPSFLFPRPLRRITPSWTTVPPFIRPDSTKRPVRIPRIVTSSFYKPRGQEKQIEPISGVEITLKTTTANVEMYYLHPPNPIYFMHILPSKLNTACSLFGKSL